MLDPASLGGALGCALRRPLYEQVLQSSARAPELRQALQRRPGLESSFPVGPGAGQRGVELELEVTVELVAHVEHEMTVGVAGAPRADSLSAVSARGGARLAPAA